MPMFDGAIDAHLKALEPKPQRQAAEKQKPPGRYSGVVARWSRFNYGFIKSDNPIPEIDSEVFVGAIQLKRSGIRHPLKLGDKVCFDLRKTGDGRYEAENIGLLEPAQAA
jgi:cold shock CspA family protein